MNPEKYTFHYKIEQDTTQAAGTSSPAPRFSAIAPEELELILFLTELVLLPVRKVQKMVLSKTLNILEK